MGARQEFLETFAPAIVRNSPHYYAIPHEGSQTPPELFEKVMTNTSSAWTRAGPIG